MHASLPVHPRPSAPRREASLPFQTPVKKQPIPFPSVRFQGSSLVPSGPQGSPSSSGGHGLPPRRSGRSPYPAGTGRKYTARRGGRPSPGHCPRFLPGDGLRNGLLIPSGSKSCLPLPAHERQRVGSASPGQRPFRCVCDIHRTSLPQQPGNHPSRGWA